MSARDQGTHTETSGLQTGTNPKRGASSTPAIRVEGLGKEYVIGSRERVPHTFREMLGGALSAPLRRLRRLRGEVGNEERFWALQDVSFEIAPGEVVGIIGRNGAGKSTLLKILSRITEPTRGRVEIRGRVSSLLEVGTGFHPELTGRENIYLNGAILGMTRREIDQKFDEIVAFAEVEKFLDTAVKYYSSGMYVRLAFAVAAHLEPEVLLVDEVLAVGDTVFQRKCLGKMEDVARGGRTVLFVSHNMAAIRSLCTRGLVIKSGCLALDADVESATNFYMAEDVSSEAQIVWDVDSAPQCAEVRFVRACVINKMGQVAPNIDCRDGFSVLIEYEVLRSVRGLRTGFMIQNVQGVSICGSTDFEGFRDAERRPGRYISRCKIPGYTLNGGRYLVCFAADAPPYVERLMVTPFCIAFDVEDIEGHGPLKERLPGVLRPKVTWSVEELAV